MTQCNSRIEIGILHSKEIVADFDAGLIGSNGELLLARARSATGPDYETDGGSCPSSTACMITIATCL